MAIVLKSQYHWPDGRPKRFYVADGTRKGAAAAKPAAKKPSRAAAIMAEIERSGAARRVVASLTRPKTVAGKALAPVPDYRSCHPTLLLRDEARRDFDALWKWAKSADEARGHYSATQRALRAEVGKRLSELRSVIWA